MKTQGIVYVAIGEKALSMAITSAQSVIDTSSARQLITIFCDVDRSGIDSEMSFIDLSPYSESYFKDKSCLAAYLKTKLYELSPYDKTLYLDNDIRAIKDISSIWDYVRDGIGLSKAFRPLIKGCKYAEGLEESYTANVISNWHQYNSGMFLFVKSPLMSSFFNNWYREWSKFKNHENMALTRLLDYSKVQPIELPSKYNEFYPDRNASSILIHYISHYKKYW
jgi:Glycosyl transferase family 8